MERIRFKYKVKLQINLVIILARLALICMR